MSRDYLHYDYLSVSVKSEHLDKILSCYSALGWKERKREDDRQYSDMKYLSFVRPHKINNKDRLQYLQVRMESAINSMSMHYSRKHKKSVLYGSVLAVFAAVLIAAGLLLLFGADGKSSDIFGFICLGAAPVSVAVFIVPLCLLRKKENLLAEERFKKSLELIDSLIAEAETLSESHVEKDIFGDTRDEPENYVIIMESGGAL